MAPSKMDTAKEGFLITIRSEAKHGILYRAGRQHGSQVKLSEFLGISQASINHWVNLRDYPRRAFNATNALQRERECVRWNTKLAKIGTSLADCWPPEVRQFIDRTKELTSLVIEQTMEVPLSRLTSSVAAQIEAPDAAVGARLEQEELGDRIGAVLKTLSYREREIIKLRYGLDDGYSYTLEEVGHIFKVTKDRIRQIEAKAVRKLQQPSRAEELVGFLD